MGVVMSEENTFAQFIRRIRAGDQEAAVDLVREYEPLIRREVKLRLHDPNLRRVLDSVDISQSVLRSFFVRVAAGQFDLDRREDLLNLLLRMAQNKVIDQARRRQRRAEVDNVAADPEALDRVAALAAPPERAVLAQDLLRTVLRRLPPREHRIAELRGLGATWPQVARELSGSAEALRKQFVRAVDRVAAELGLDEAP
jgi:RNA polymerase sigma-70 factor (ECF subfamily)